MGLEVTKAGAERTCRNTTIARLGGASRPVGTDCLGEWRHPQDEVTEDALPGDTRTFSQLSARIEKGRQ